MTDTKSKCGGLDNINEIFKIPICYNKNVQKLNDHIVTDVLVSEEQANIFWNIIREIKVKKVLR